MLILRHNGEGLLRGKGDLRESGFGMGVGGGLDESIMCIEVQQ